MKATELRIGNLVDLYANNILVSESHEIIADDFKNIEALCLIGFKPIPLTEEWLLKFGFNKDDSYENYSYYTKKGFDMLKDYGNQGIAIPNNEDVYIHLYCGYYCNEIDFKYVHELQNLYFVLTGEELTYETL